MEIEIIEAIIIDEQNTHNDLRSTHICPNMRSEIRPSCAIRCPNFKLLIISNWTYFFHMYTMHERHVCPFCPPAGAENTDVSIRALYELRYRTYVNSPLVHVSMCP